jgi:hypothetical protein
MPSQSNLEAAMRSQILVFGLIIGPASAAAADHLATQPLKTVTDAGPTQFERLAPDQSGVDMTIPIDTQHALKRLYSGGFFCGGVSIGDLDGDGRPDLFLVNGPGPNRLYRQRDELVFEDITSQAGVDGRDDWGVGSALVDIDNDGDLDIYLCNYEKPNRLFINDGKGQFREAAAEYGLDFVDSSVFAAFCDYDRDGDLDCYLLTNRVFRPGGLPSDLKLITQAGRVALPKEYHRYYSLRATGRNKGELQLIGRPDRLLRNEGNGRFSDVTSRAGIRIEPDHGLGATWWDYNADGLPDLYVCNDFNDPDHLYHNNGDGTFTDVVQERLPHTAWFSMGADAGDVNNDGRLDLLVADMSGTTHYEQKISMGAMGGKNAWFLEFARPLQYMRNAFYLNTGTDRFLEIAYLTGLDSTDWTWSVKFADLDNDGRLDIYVTNGMTRNLNDSDLPFTIADQVGKSKWDLYEDQPPLKQQNLAFRNLGDLQFEDVSAAWRLNHVGISCSAAVGDLDRDGDLDLVVANMDEPVSIYRNRSATGNRLLVELRGTRSNRFGVGATVRIETATGQQVRQQFPATGYLASHDPLVHFGVGDDVRVDRLTVEWPSGTRQEFQDLPVNSLHSITEPAESVAATNPTFPEPVDRLRTRPAPRFEVVSTFDQARHQETPFDDFRRQPLLPNRMSQLGPGVTCGDVDGDGDDDIFLGGAAGQSGRLFFNRGSGRFEPGDAYPFRQAAASEDMAALLVDVDGDGDLDLYVVSGGVECDPGAPELADRLYLNKGRGHFVPAAPDALPRVFDSGSTVTCADFDRDGDLDLFVGGRVVPGQYPAIPTSRLLRNDKGRFIDVTRDVAPELARTGMVTASLWSDVDHDGWLDLLVTHEWGPVKLFRNRQGRLEDHTSQTGIHELSGWWNAIAGRDLNGDGHIDYVVSNFGLNTKYHASLEKPALLYYGDFDNSGQMNLIEAEFENELLFPLRGRSCSSNAMPFLRQKFDSYKSFALAELNEIYEPQHLDSAVRFAATTLQSGALINDGTGRFRFQPLPRIAQVAPTFGIILTELNGDGRCDAYLAQNFFTPQIETGRMDGGISLLLDGQGDGTFQPVDSAISGLVVPGDAKGLATLDLDGDLQPDLLVSVNDDRPAAFLNRAAPPENIVTVRLRGVPGNSTAVGARVTVRLADQTQQTAEVYGGSGYLSQSSADLSFGTAGQPIAAIDVTWPDGRMTTERPIAGTRMTQIRP